MPKPAPKFSAKTHRSAKSSSSSKRNIRRKLIYILAVSATCVALAGLAGILHFEPKPNDQVLSDTEFRPTTIDPNFEDQVRGCFFPVAKVYGYQLDIVSGFRSSADQDVLYAQGRTTPGDVITNARGGQSLHNFGLAVDVVDDHLSYEIDWQRLGRIGAYCGLEQGDRGHEDLPHFQYRDGLSLSQIAAGQRLDQLRFPCQIMTRRYQQDQPLTKKDLDACKAPKF